MLFRSLLHEKGLQDRIRSITNQTQSSSEPLADSISDDSTLSYASTSPEPKPVPPPRRCYEREFCQTCRYPTKYDHILWAMRKDDYEGQTCRCPKESTADKPPILPEAIEPRPVYPHPSTPHCKKCDALHIKRYCPEYTCIYCWTTTPGHWPNRCLKKTFQKYWWKKTTRRNKDQESMHSWDDCHASILLSFHPMLLAYLISDSFTSCTLLLTHGHFL